MYANEFQRQVSDDSERKWRFRNFEVGGDVGLEFSRFLFPVKQQNVPKKFRAKTIINVGSNYQVQDNYSRFITSTGFRYEWRTSPQITHILSVLNINLVKIYPDSLFKVNIQRYSKRIQEKYKDHLLIGTNYQLVYSSYKGLHVKISFFYVLIPNLTATHFMLFLHQLKQRKMRTINIIFGVFRLQVMCRQILI